MALHFVVFECDAQAWCIRDLDEALVDDGLLDPCHQALPERHVEEVVLKREEVARRRRERTQAMQPTGFPAKCIAIGTPLSSCGVTRELGEDPVADCRYCASRDPINHMHYRNPHVTVPYRKYDEGFINEGDINMFAVMRELVKEKYAREFYPEHGRALDYDRARGPIHG